MRTIIPQDLQLASLVREKHGHTIWSVAWSTDEYHVEEMMTTNKIPIPPILAATRAAAVPTRIPPHPKRQESVRYMATCGGKYVSLYQVSDSDKSDDAMILRQAYVDRDDDEIFFSCAFGGRSLGRPFGYTPVHSKNNNTADKMEPFRLALPILLNLVMNLFYCITTGIA